MNTYPETVKSKLLEQISELADYSWLFSHNPDSDFSRKRKLDFEDTVRLIISMEGSSMNHELLKYFNFDGNTPSSSAFNQQRSKILPEAFDFLFHEFNNAFPLESTYRGYHLIACDGSDVNIAHNPLDSDNYFHSKDINNRGFNQLHLNALYDLCSRRYVDAIIQPGVKNNEPRAFCEMMDRYHATDTRKTIFIADRGYSAYNVYAHAQSIGAYYLIRAKDFTSACAMLSTYTLPDTDEFDVTIKRFLTHHRTKKMKDQPDIYKYLSPENPFDFLGTEDPKLYYMEFRVVRFAISDGSYECIITNLPSYAFPPEEIKKIYHVRWGIETSFRELKYAIGMVGFHSKKVEYIKQEIFARLILYNFCEIITTHVVLNKTKVKAKKHTYQVNFTMAFQICKHLLRIVSEYTPPDVEALISRYILPVRPNRQVRRNVRAQSAVSFIYRLV